MKSTARSSKQTVKDWIKAVLVGLACGVVVFLVSGDGIYMCLFYWEGLDRLPPGSAPDAGPGVFWALGWGMLLGAIFGVVACILGARYWHHRKTVASKTKPE
jgi:hypothetical protein